MNILITHNLTKQFAGVKALDGVSLEFPKGKITGLIGPNGSGKTTLINVISGLLSIDHGSIIINEKKLDCIHSHEIPALGLARTFQNIRLFNQMNILDNILLALNGKRALKTLMFKQPKFLKENAEEILKKVGLFEKRNKLAEELSYGQRKLLEIGRALAANTEIMLLDEPFAGLFPQMIETVQNILEELRQQGKTIILIEHNINLIRKLCDYIIVLDAGKLLTAGTPEETLSKHEVLEAYLGE